MVSILKKNSNSCFQNRVNSQLKLSSSSFLVVVYLIFLLSQSFSLKTLYSYFAVGFGLFFFFLVFFSFYLFILIVLFSFSLLEILGVHVCILVHVCIHVHAGTYVHACLRIALYLSMEHLIAQRSPSLGQLAASASVIKLYLSIIIH